MVVLETVKGADGRSASDDGVGCDGSGSIGGNG